MKYKLMIFIVASAILLSSCSKNEQNTIANTMGNSSGNMLNGGCLAQQGDEVYFLDQGGLPIISALTIFFPFSKLNRIFSLGDNGSISKKLCNNISGGSLSIVGSRVYFLGVDGELEPNSELYCYDMKLKKTKKISDEGIGYAIDNGSIFHFSEEKNNTQVIVKTDLDGKNPKIIATAQYFGDFECDSGYVYYMTLTDAYADDGTSISGPLYRVKEDGSDKKEILPATNAQIFLIDKNVLYYTEDNKKDLLFELNLTTNIITKINVDMYDENAENFNVADGWIYYIGNEMHLYKIRTNGKGNMLLYKGKADKVYLAKGQVYFYNYDNYDFYRIDSDGSKLKKINSFF